MPLDAVNSPTSPTADTVVHLNVNINDLKSKKQRFSDNHYSIWVPLLRRLSPSNQLFFALGYLGLSFSVIFTGFNVAQSFVTTIFQGSFGFTVLFMIYLPFGVSAILAPLIINSRWLTRISGGRNERLALTATSIGYLLFMVAVALRNQPLVSVGAVWCGLCSGILWISQGVWLTKSVKHYLATAATDSNIGGGKIVGTATGVFFTLFNINGILGNAIAIGFLRSNDAEAFKVLLYIAVLIVAVGCLMLSITPQLFPLHRQTSELVVVESARAVRPSATELRTAESKSSESLIDPALDTLKSKPFDSFKQQMRDLWLLIKSDKCRLLMPYMICQGVNISFDFGNFPKYIAYACLNLTDPQLASDAESPVIPLHISQVFLLYGVGSILGALLWGRVYDRLMGRLTPLLVAHVLLVTLSTSLLMSTVFVPLINSSVSLLSLIGFLFGLTDFLTNSIINNSASKLFHGSDVARLYSWYRFCFCIGYAVNAFISGLTPRLEAYSDPLVGGGGWAKFGWLTNVVFSVSMMLISVVAGYRLDRAIISNSQKHCQEEEEDSQVIYASKSMEVTTT